MEIDLVPIVGKLGKKAACLAVVPSALFLLLRLRLPRREQQRRRRKKKAPTMNAMTNDAINAKIAGWWNECGKM
jgi:hypothetical protein